MSVEITMSMGKIHEHDDQPMVAVGSIDVDPFEPPSCPWLMQVGRYWEPTVPLMLDSECKWTHRIWDFRNWSWFLTVVLVFFKIISCTYMTLYMCICIYIYMYKIIILYIYYWIGSQYMLIIMFCNVLPYVPASQCHWGLHSSVGSGSTPSPPWNWANVSLVIVNLRSLVPANQYFLGGDPPA